MLAAEDTLDVGRGLAYYSVAEGLWSHIADHLESQAVSGSGTSAVDLPEGCDTPESTSDEDRSGRVDSCMDAGSDADAGRSNNGSDTEPLEQVNGRQNAQCQAHPPLHCDMMGC